MLGQIMLVDTTLPQSNVNNLNAGFTMSPMMGASRQNLDECKYFVKLLSILTLSVICILVGQVSGLNLDHQNNIIDADALKAEDDNEDNEDVFDDDDDEEMKEE